MHWLLSWIIDSKTQFWYEDEATTWLLRFLRDTHEVWLRKESDTWLWNKSVDVRWWHKWWLSIAIEVKMFRNKKYKEDNLLSMLEPHQALDLYEATLRGVDTYIAVYHTLDFKFYIYKLWLENQQLQLQKL